jgi:hypothetical protein
VQDWLEWQRKVIREEYVEGEPMQKRYVVEKTIKTPDGEKLQVVEVVESKPKDFSLHHIRSKIGDNSPL